MSTSRSLQLGNVEMQDRAEIFRFGDTVVLAVADGAGGISGGAEAAELFINLVRDAAALLNSADDCTQLFYKIDREIEDRPLCGQTTGIIVGIGSSTIFGASVGDSAAKWFGSNVVDDLTGGQCRHPFLGDGARPIGFTRTLNPGTIVVGTDGLWKYTGVDLIAQVARTGSSTELGRHLSDLVRFPSGTYPDDVAILTYRIS